MSATVVDIAEAVVVALNGATLSLPFTAERSYLAVVPFEELDALKVRVVPGEAVLAGWDLQPRREWQWDIGIWVQVRVASASPEECDPLMVLCEEIAGLFHMRQLAGVPGCRCIGLAFQPAFDPARLDTERSFLAAVVPKFRFPRA